LITTLQELKELFFPGPSLPAGGYWIARICVDGHGGTDELVRKRKPETRRLVAYLVSPFINAINYIELIDQPLSVPCVCIEF
jgi:hypothetical protein